MSWATGRRGWRITSHIASRTGRGSTGGKCRPLAVVTRDSSTRDSGSHFQAKNTLTTHSAAATRPGAVSPACVASEPRAGPTMTPRLVAAESHPKALARSFAGMVSATYACATPVVPPPRPCTNRETKSSHRASANPKIRYARAEAPKPTRIAGRRP